MMEQNGDTSTVRKWSEMRERRGGRREEEGEERRERDAGEEGGTKEGRI